METLAAIYQELLAGLASQFGAARVELQLFPGAGVSPEGVAAFAASPPEAGALTWLEFAVREGTANVAHLRLGLPAGAAPADPALQRFTQSLLGLLASSRQAASPANRAGRRFLAVTEEELQRIILDVHDGPVQKLFAALSQIDLLKTRLASEPGLAPERLDRISLLVETSLGEIKTGLGTFRPPGFRTRPLVSVLKGLVLQHEALTGMRAELEVEGEVPAVALPVKIALYRILQEALSNVTRHTKVDRLVIRLGGGGGWVILEVIDKGPGFDPPPLDGPLGTEQERHIGLRGMRERTELVAGTFSLTSRPGQGTRIEVRVPGDA